MFFFSPFPLGILNQNSLRELNYVYLDMNGLL